MPISGAAGGDTGALPWHLRRAADALHTLDVDPETGLDSDEADRRLARYGANELRPAPPVPLWRKIVRQFQDPLIYLLLAAIAISVLAWAVEGAAGVPVDALVIGAVVLFNGVLGFVQENKAESAVAALRLMTAANSTVLRDGQLKTVPSAELVRRRHPGPQRGGLRRCRCQADHGKFPGRRRVLADRRKRARLQGPPDPQR